MTRSTFSFADLLLDWYSRQHRPMPWRGEGDPYRVWLSEIILQQTRIEQGLPYYLRFISAYPTVHHLAHAPIDEVMRVWQGLGYYNRVRNLHATAKYVSEILQGIFPNTYHDLLKLKGVGPYTAAAIASIVYREPTAVVDGNVIRVLARVYGIAHPFDTTIGKATFQSQATALIDTTRPGDFNQAIMDLGATVCTPRSPSCIDCPMSNICHAFATQTIADYPVRSRKIAKRTRYFYYLVIREGQRIRISKRIDKDIWQGLYELPLIETDLPIKRGLKNQVDKALGVACTTITILDSYTQQLSHQTIQATFIEVEGEEWAASPMLVDTLAVGKKKLSSFAFPRVVHLFLSDYSLL